jgi:hypothetical protein
MNILKPLQETAGAFFIQVGPLVAAFWQRMVKPSWDKGKNIYFRLPLQAAWRARAE